MVTAPTAQQQRLSDFRVHTQDARISGHCMVSVNISIPRGEFPKPPLVAAPCVDGTAVKLHPGSSADAVPTVGRLECRLEVCQVLEL